MKKIIWEITMEEKNNKEKIAEESVQSNENTVVEEANNKELEINKEETTGWEICGQLSCDNW